LRRRFAAPAPSASPGAGLPREAGRAAQAQGWGYGALSGRVVELSAARASAVLTMALGLVWEAQREGEPVAWVGDGRSAFYPPDAAANGVDLAALAVVRLPEARTVPRAAERLARSGAFGLIVLDLGRTAIPPALQGRLAQQAQRHGMAIVCLTEKAGRAPSLGSLVSLRAHARRRRSGENRFAGTLAVSKDKRRGPGWSHAEVHHGPPGLR
jgi:recombination protein RecA